MTSSNELRAPRCRRSVRSGGLTCARFSVPPLTRKSATQLWPSLVRLGSCHVRPMCAQAASERQPEGLLVRHGHYSAMAAT
jgi:hypothetical protein